jgi:hypothetical protein
MYNKIIADNMDRELVLIKNMTDNEIFVFIHDLADNFRFNWVFHKNMAVEYLKIFDVATFEFNPIHCCWEKLRDNCKDVMPTNYFLKAYFKYILERLEQVNSNYSIYQSAFKGLKHFDFL